MRVTRNLIILLSLVWALDASAQEFNSQAFKPAVGPDAIFSVEGADTVGHLQPTGAVILNYASRSLLLQQGDQEVALVDQQLALNTMFGFGVLDRLQFDLHIPFYFVNQGTTLTGDAFEGLAIGDLNFRPKVNILSSKEDGGFGLGALIDLQIPTGTRGVFVTSDSFEVTPKVLADYRIGPVLIAANVGVNVTNNRNLGATEVSDGITYGLGGEVGVLNGLLLFDAEIYGQTGFSDFFGEDVSPLEGLVGAKVVTSYGLSVMAGGGGGLVPGVGSPEFRAFVGLGWAKRSSDFDGDGIANNADDCPEDPEDLDGFEDEDGCPETDNDGDTITDDEDNCPDDAEDADGFEDDDGCPDPDNDGDGIADETDACPDDPEDVNGVKDEDGCPDADLDTDKDGIPDAKDKCPDKPEDMDGFEDTDGCPELDNDNDGIVDPDDQCPLKPGLPEDNGCPPKKMKAVLEKDNIKILEKVYFESDKAVILQDSFNLLDQVALIIRTNAQVKMVEIGGHTDDRGKDEYNQQLSEARANAVKSYLEKKGVEASRLKAVGYGESKPIETKKTKAARAKNRRVEFVIAEQDLTIKEADAPE